MGFAGFSVVVGLQVKIEFEVSESEDAVAEMRVGQRWNSSSVARSEQDNKNIAESYQMSSLAEIQTATTPTNKNSCSSFFTQVK